VPPASWERWKMTIASFLIIAWILSWFKFDRLFIQAFKELFKKEVTKATYYFTFFCIGTIGDITLFFNGTSYEVLVR
jgi:hypothetical protein